MPDKKKVPKWVIPAGALVVIGGGYYLYRRKKANEEGTKQSETNPYLAQSFIPVTAENVAGAGAVSTPFGESGNNEALINAQKENEGLIFSLLENQERQSAERSASNQQFLGTLIESIKNQTGGGAPQGGAANTVAATTSPGTKTVASNTPKKKCPVNFPSLNSSNGQCYHPGVSSSGCSCHVYQNGKKECQTGKPPHCNW